MDFRWLQDFLSLADANNFTEAAAARHSSQPAFSRRIKALESWLGVELIDRSRYPTRLTPAGERFRQSAADMVQKMIDARAGIHGEPERADEIITFALPHTLAISRFPDWWRTWRPASGAAGCRLLASNVHDAVTAHVAGLADVLICFHQAQQPVFLDPDHHVRVAVGTEWLRPYAAARRGQLQLKLPGTVRSPLPLANYSPSTFFGRMVDVILQSAPEKIYTTLACESDLADVILKMVIAGHGVGWLTECTAAEAIAAGKLKCAGDDRWSLPLTVYAYCDRSRATPAVQRLMAHLQKAAANQPGDGQKTVPLHAGAEA